jgi:hypothetical protein
MKTPNESEEDAHTINRLSEITGVDRRTIRKRVEGVKPAKVVNGRKYYRIADAGEPGRPNMRGYRYDGNDEHWFHDPFKAVFVAAAAIDQAIEQWLKMAAKIKAISLQRGTVENEILEDEINQQTLVHEKPVAELLLYGHVQKRNKKTIERLIEAYAAIAPIIQAILDIEAVFNVTGFFNSTVGREIKASALRSKKQKRKKSYSLGPAWTREDWDPSTAEMRKL